MLHKIRFTYWMPVVAAVFALTVGDTISLAKGPGGGGPPSPPPPATAPPYSITLLGTLGGDRSAANAINAAGDVVGWSFTGVIAGYTLNHAFLNVDDGNGGRIMIDLHDRFVNEGLIPPFDFDTLTGFIIHEAQDINENGQIVGKIDEHNGTYVASIGFRYTPAGTDALGNPVAPVLDWLGNIQGLSINNNGVVAGTDYSVSVPSAVIWNGVNDITPIGATIAIDNYAIDINDSGQVVGRTSNYNSHAWRYTPGVGLEDVPLLSKKTIANPSFSINELGEITVEDSTFGNFANRRSRACLFSDNAGTVDLGTLGGDNSTASWCNNLGDVVGVAERADGTSHLFLYTSALGMTDLEASIVNLPPELSGNLQIWNLDINDAGQICGSSNYNDGTLSEQAYLLAPVP